MSLPAGLEVRRFDAQTASAGELAELITFSNIVCVEFRPDRPPKTVEELMRDLRARPSWLTSCDWLVRSSGQVVATAYLHVWRAEQNQHLADFWIGVLPGMRRRGIATELLRLITEAAEAENRQLLTAASTSNVAAGELFLKRYGAELVQTWSMNRLQMTAVNLEAVRLWLNRGAALEDEFELGLWEGPYPEEDLETVVRMLEVMNTAPQGDIEREDVHYMPQQQREWDVSLVARGRQRWTVYVRHRPSGEIAGFTEVVWSPDQPRQLEQGDTGVFPEYRNRGLARWIKAVMITKVPKERPQVEFIQTGNAAANASMLHINEELGFRPALTAFTWKIELERLMQYLAGR